MRIAYICADPGVPVFGRKGCSVHVQEMLRAFLKRGATVDLFAVRFGGECPRDLKLVRLRELKGFRHPADAEDGQAVNQANALQLSELERRGPFDLVYERYSLWSSAGMRFARSAGVPGVLEVNAPLIEEQARYRHLNSPKLAQRIASQAFESAAVICAVSSQVADYLGRFPETRGRTHILPNGVDPARFHYRTGGSKLLERSPQEFTIGFVGSLKPWHGLPMLVEAFGQLHRANPQTRLLIVGDGPERESLLGQLEAESLDVLNASHMIGAVPLEDVPDYLSQMDVAVAPYPALTDFYFSPLKIFEYMAAGLPVIASRVGDLPEILCHGTNGILYAPGDVAELTQQLNRLRRAPALRRRLGEAARATVHERHTWQSIVEKVLELAGVTETSLSELPPRKGSYVSSPVNA